ncbi:MAG: hypothetical protein ABII26_11680 [Pseudomonadota bacterium]
MDKIVNIQERLERNKHKRLLERDRGKIEAIQKVIQCSSCHFRCAMCGLYIKESESSSHTNHIQGYAFCESCGGEFEDFLTVSRGEHPDLLWHNKEWVKMWSAWLNYRKAIDDFINSAEFKRLLE